MPSHAGPKTITSGALLILDTSDINSYPGEPTINTSDEDSYQYWNNVGASTIDVNYTLIGKPFEYPNIKVHSSMKLTNGNTHLGVPSSAPLTTSTQYAASVYFWKDPGPTGSMLGSVPYFRQQPLNASIGTLSYNGSTNWNTWPSNKWIRISGVFTTTATSASYMYISSYINSTGNRMAFYAPMIEAKSHVTPYVYGQRESGSGWKDLGGRGHNADLTYTDYDSSGSIRFGNSNGATIAQSTDFFSNTFSWEIVAKFTGSFSTYQGYVWAEGATGGGSGYQFLFSLYNNSYFHYRVYNTVTSWTSTNTSPIEFDEFEYHHLVWQFDSGTTRIYVNGNLWHTDTSRGTYSGGTDSPVWIGCRNDRVYSAKAHIPMVRFYNRVLSAQEITQNFNAVKTKYGIV